MSARKTTLTTSAAENAVVDELQQTATASVAEMNESESDAKKPRTRKKSVTTELVAEEKPKRTRAKKSTSSEPAHVEAPAAEEPPHGRARSRCSSLHGCAWVSLQPRALS